MQLTLKVTHTHKKSFTFFTSTSNSAGLKILFELSVTQTDVST